MNRIKTALLLGLLSGVLLLLGERLGGGNGLAIGLALAVAMNFASYFFSDKIALSMYSAQPVSETENWRGLPAAGPAGPESLPRGWGCRCPGSG